MKKLFFSLLVVLSSFGVSANDVFNWRINSSGMAVAVSMDMKVLAVVDGFGYLVFKDIYGECENPSEVRSRNLPINYQPVRFEYVCSDDGVFYRPKSDKNNEKILNMFLNDQLVLFVQSPISTDSFSEVRSQYLNSLSNE